jgi:molybdopterin converting factor small subunit
MRSFLIVACLVALGMAVVLRKPSPSNSSSPAAKPQDGKAQVAELRSQLQKISAGLSSMLDPKGALAKTDVAKSLNAFTTELATTLKETANATDTTKAIKQLQDAKGGVKALMRDLTTQQMRLMKESDEQQESLLLGVLMTRQKEPIEKQMEVLNSSEFKNLPVVAELIKAKDNKTPLFKQVAAYLDKHGDGKSLEKAKALKVDRNGKRDLSSIIDPLQTRIQHLKDADKHRAERHTLEIKKMDEKLKNASSSLKHRLELMKKKSERQFKKDSLLAKSDIESLESAVAAIKKGDMVALKKAQDALQAHLKAMESHNSGFIVFIQLAHQMEGRDCPYCAAQCIEKCSAGGKSYAQCLTDCADAGK